MEVEPVAGFLPHPMRGLSKIAWKMLVRERAKFSILVFALGFCTLLIVQQASIFCGLMYWTTANLRNFNAPIWVVDQQVEDPNATVGLRNIEVERVRSISGVGWAYPLFLGNLSARLSNGQQQTVQMVGIDATSLVGRPLHMRSGRVEDLRLPDAVIVDRQTETFFTRKGITLRIGSLFEINDRRAQVVGFCDTAKSFAGQPCVFSTFDRALDYAPPQRTQLSAILVAPVPGVSSSELVTRMNRLKGLHAIARDAFFWQTIWFYVETSGIPISFGTVVVLGVVVGIAVAGQTFYLFVNDNLRYLAALKAMGATNGRLAMMVASQAANVGFLGFGLGSGVAALFGFGAMKDPDFPFILPWPVIAFAAAVTVFICLVSGAIALRRIATIEPATVFK